MQLVSHFRESPAFAASGRALMEYGAKWNVEMPRELKTALEDQQSGTAYFPFEGDLDWPPNAPSSMKIVAPKLESR
jgi:hypothetical protein